MAGSLPQTTEQELSPAEQRGGTNPSCSAQHRWLSQPQPLSHSRGLDPSLPLRETANSRGSALQLGVAGGPVQGPWASPGTSCNWRFASWEQRLGKGRSKAEAGPPGRGCSTVVL